MGLDTLALSYAKNVAYTILGVSVVASYNEYYCIPYNLTPIFTGRGDVIQKLHDRCLPPKREDSLTEQKRFVLYGLGGSGKTQICLKFAQEYRERYAIALELFCVYFW